MLSSKMPLHSRADAASFLAKLTFRHVRATDLNLLHGLTEEGDSGESRGTEEISRITHDHPDQGVMTSNMETDLFENITKPEGNIQFKCDYCGDNTVNDRKKTIVRHLEVYAAPATYQIISPPCAGQDT